MLPKNSLLLHVLINQPVGEKILAIFFTKIKLLPASCKLEMCHHSCVFFPLHIIDDLSSRVKILSYTRGDVEGILFPHLSPLLISLFHEHPHTSPEARALSTDDVSDLVTPTAIMDTPNGWVSGEKVMMLGKWKSFLFNTHFT